MMRWILPGMAIQEFVTAGLAAIGGVSAVQQAIAGVLFLACMSLVAYAQRCSKEGNA